MSSSYQDCAKTGALVAVQSALASEPNVQVGTVTADPLNLSLATPNVGFLIDVGVVDPTLGEGAYVADDHIEVFQGPYQGVVDILTINSNPIADTLVQEEASAVAQRLADLPQAGTLHSGAV
jgi:hypothetical protein